MTEPRSPGSEITPGAEVRWGAPCNFRTPDLRLDFNHSSGAAEQKSKRGSKMQFSVFEARQVQECENPTSSFLARNPFLYLQGSSSSI